MTNEKQSIVETYFTRLEEEGSALLVRKSDNRKFKIRDLAFYNNDQLREVGIGLTTPEFLSE